ncbi:MULTISPECIES: prepilin-type N-terminal cleavage/methylation domain-containing protein [unclassified Lentimonas]|uniref:prepilin-type N-terminal cleavage/methylation domain-containing protein n=1 Tax=unclassified Lentimonas TaxID=2630993 RepID=UPI00132C5E4A|nr:MULTISPECIES: prepilin-type N-terminal cleavage/methylation domain-containing protein [unclassified Lentimonas]CAA6680198.1 Unannotated [Lentimonas sp. CC4]CAA6687048.1 Unannotated [Lentimonas sp. CC6]CAA6695179.1 Unannotated [Lentimonas sp. CC19]CAA6697263.1 Unannotated [Lentimonas sp. CC10]CAA7070436.1 Unannotated [Lentimonas sp. CC11]
MQNKPPRGFSLVELLVVVSVISILALLAVPEVMTAAHRAKTTVTANDIRVITKAIEYYSTAKGAYPARMSINSLPEPIKGYLPKIWTDGTYSWSYRNSDKFTYFYVYNLDFTPEQALHLDSIVDDGNIGTGKMVIGMGGSGLMYLFKDR